MDNKLSFIKERVIYIIEYHGDVKEKFFDKIGMTYGNFKGSQKKTPLNSTAVANILSIYNDINPDWLLTGKGDMLRVAAPVAARGAGASPEGLRPVPLVSLAAVAGFGSSGFAITEQDIEANYVVPDFNGIDFMIRVKGSSMYPKYSSGDIIACRKINDSQFIQWNKCHVVATREQGLLVKRLKKGATENSILALSDNKEYDPFEIPLDEITGIAIVVGVIRLE